MTYPQNEYPYQITILHFESKYFKTISSLANFSISWNIFNENVITRTYCWFVFDFPLSYILINGWAAHILSTWISFLVAWRYSSISSSLSFSWVKSIILTAYSLWVDFSMHLLTVLLTPLQHQTKGGSLKITYTKVQHNTAQDKGDQFILTAEHLVFTIFRMIHSRTSCIMSARSLLGIY